MRELIRNTVRNLRKEQTQAEEIFWQAIRNRQIKNRKFVRQFAIPFDYENKKRFFIADFYCHESKLIVEIDGKIHENQKGYDILRTHILNNLGYNIVRFKNEDVLQGLDEVIKNLEEYL